MKPDYSSIPAMACKCGSIEERDEILRQLKEWGVPMSAVLKGILLGELDDGLWLYIDEKQTNYMVFIGDSLEENLPENAIDYQVSPSDFLSKFREVCEASKAPVIDKGIVFPSDDDIDLYIMKDAAECPRKRAFEWYKSEIIRLNPHLKV